MKKNKFWTLTVLVSMAFMLGACAPVLKAEQAVEEIFVGQPASVPSYDEYAEEAAVEKEVVVESSREYNAGGGELASAVERMIIYNADMQISVENPKDVMDSVITLAKDAGGHIVYSNLQKVTSSRGSLPRASVTVRVPAEKLDSIMEAIKALTPDPSEDVIYENISGQDVTSEFTDLQSRLRNLEAAESALVELMAKAKDPEDVLNVFDELTYYRGEIEVVKGRMKYLSESAAMSALSVEIIAKESLQPIDIPGWQPSATANRAIETLIDVAQSVADALIQFGIVCLPFVIPLGIGVFFLIRWIRKIRAAKKAKKAEVVETLNTEQTEE